MRYNKPMKVDGAHNIFKLQDIRRYPLFYIELFYALSTLFGTALLFFNEGVSSQRVPTDTSPFWEAAASHIGIVALVVGAVVIALIGLFGLFKGGFKWRAVHMFGQFLLRLYVTMGYLSIYGLFPTTWLSGAVLCAIAGVMYLKLRWEAVRWEAYLGDARH